MLEAMVLHLQVGFGDRKPDSNGWADSCCRLLMAEGSDCKLAKPVQPATEQTPLCRQLKAKARLQRSTPPCMKGSATHVHTPFDSSPLPVGLADELVLLQLLPLYIHGLLSRNNQAETGDKSP